MYCKYCGGKIDNDSSFCVHCGKPQSQNNEPKDDSKVRNQLIEELDYKTKIAQNEIDLLSNEDDLTYTSNELYLRSGIVLIIIVVVLNIILQLNDAEEEVVLALNGFIFVVKLFFAISVSQTAKILKKDQFLWFVFTLFLTGIALIIFGTFKKKLSLEDFQSGTNQEKSKFLNKYAYTIADKKKLYKKAESIINKAIEIDNSNHAAYATRAYIRYYLLNYESALKDSNISIEMNSSVAIKYYHRGYILLKMNKKEEACKDWKQASDMGYFPAKESIRIYCKKIDK